MDWFPYDNGLRHERVKLVHNTFQDSKLSASDRYQVKIKVKIDLTSTSYCCV